MERDDLSWNGESCEIHSTSEWVRVYRSDTDQMLWHLQWDDVEEIAVWKQDFFTADRVCTGFAWRGSDALKRVDEDMGGWDEMHEALEQQFGVKISEWWPDVVQPPFANNFKVIWSKDASLREDD